MKSLIFVSCLLAALAFADASSNQTYASIAPQKYAVRLAFNVSGTVSAPTPPCNSSAVNNPCIPQVQAAQDGIAIEWNVKANYTANSTSTITIKACYSPTSSQNRPWRKANPVISNNKQCGVTVATGKAPEGSFIYRPGPNTAPATYTIQVLEVCQGGAYCSFGNYTGYYQINKIDDRPGWLMALTGVFACIGPVTLVTYMIVEKSRKKSQ